MPLSYDKRKVVDPQIEKLLIAINHAAISLIQTNTSRFSEEMIRTRMQRIASDLILASYIGINYENTNVSEVISELEEINE